MNTDAEESIVQHFPHRCPYCDQPVSYEAFELRTGENEIECPFCKKMFIKVVAGASMVLPSQKAPHACCSALRRASTALAVRLRRRDRGDEIA